MNVLALDLGSTTGWAFSVRRPDGKRFEASGTWQLATEKAMRAARKERRDRTGDPRVFALQENLTRLLHESGIRIEAVVFEDVLFRSSRSQTQLWSSFRTTVWLVANDFGIRKIAAVPTGTLKKFATGNGDADKEKIEASFRREFEGRPSADDNERDAVYLLHWALTNLKP